ncbi:30S ribosomal protein S17 [Mesomycoplasma bovoculi]|uniref:Small ribosomal subunit protein uS17 n=1 Tax=Mesomycoplasma bovoculi M165/69 TaxID=743966 RepID=W5UT71_9BACT|nr:30S ribosomal protein S17 [Mesomycoplasma bovoculi]AHH45337.1 30S ribosomal protein S17 [Mesomycoplasma bovoculi M165/69]
MTSTSVANPTLVRNSRKTLVGVVVSTACEKTITVAVETHVKHRLYGKRFKKIKKFAVHDEAAKAQMGDKVKIAETRPISKTKTFRLVEIIKKQGEH